MKTVLAGATGFIGNSLTARLLEAGHEVSVLTRSVSQVTPRTDGVILVPWNGKYPGEWCACVNGAEAVINLAGENIAARPWTAQQKHRILSSRLIATDAIVQAVTNAVCKPRVFLNASAVGYYGHVPEGEVTESYPRGGGFLADVCVRWEETALQAGRSGVRVVLPRFGPVLEKDGGVLPRMIAPFSAFIGGPLGSGQQWVPWIHRDDLVSALIFLLSRESLVGPVNVTAPEPRRMEEFCGILAKMLKRPSWLRTPGFILKLVLGEMSDMILSGARVVPAKLLASGFRFRYPDLNAALSEILKK